MMFLAVGIGNLVAPLQMVAPLSIELDDVNALNEVRANYGGMHALMGMFFFLSVFVAKLREAALLTLAVFTSGLVVGRLVSITVDGVPDTFIWVWMTIDFMGAVFAWLLLGLRSKPD